MKVGLLALVLLFLCEGCAVSVIVKDCAKTIDDSNRYVCKTMKPWE